VCPLGPSYLQSRILYIHLVYVYSVLLCIRFMSINELKLRNLESSRMLRRVVTLKLKLKTSLKSPNKTKQ
jgi:hypothetical protein